MSDKEIELEDVLLWADGIYSALHTEQATKISEKEARICTAIRDEEKEIQREIEVRKSHERS